MDYSVAREERSHPVLEECCRSFHILLIFLTAPKASLFQEAEDEDHGNTNGSDCPPKRVRPRFALNDEAPNGRTCDDSSQKTNFVTDEGFASLVKEEYVYCVGRTEDCWHRGEHPSKQPRDQKWNVVLCTGHLGSPDLAT